MDIAQEMLSKFNDNPDLLKKVKTDDESWVYGYDIETKAQSSQWKRPEEPIPKKARQVRSNVKIWELYSGALWMLATRSYGQ